MRELAALAGRVAALEARLNGVVRHGTVAQVDAEKGLVRIKFGQASEGGGDFLGPWVPYSQLAGAIKAHIPPSVGQQFTQIAPSGDWRQAVAVPMTWSDQNGSPSSAADENVITFGGVTITLKSDSLKIVVDGVSLEISGDGVTIEGGKVSHDGKNIGATHIHGGVDSGPSTTSVPAN